MAEQGSSPREAAAAADFWALIPESLTLSPEHKRVRPRRAVPSGPPPLPFGLRQEPGAEQAPLLDDDNDDCCRVCCFGVRTLPDSMISAGGSYAVFTAP